MQMDGKNVPQVGEQIKRNMKKDIKDYFEIVM